MTNNNLPTSHTPLQEEISRFEETFSLLIDLFLNRIFDLKPQKASNRMKYLTFLFIMSGFVISMIASPEHSLSQWISHAQALFLYLFNQDIAREAANQGKNYVNEFIVFTQDALTNPQTLQYLPILLASFFIAQYSAALYLADIFELNDISVARKFITEVALTGSDEVIRISAGEILAEHRQSPNYLIGGPGKVIVDLDSVALFEKPDGTPHVIGPTGSESKGRATLEGFERYRQSIDLREHFAPLRDQDEKSRSISSRSLDGIPVSAVDVQIIFSIFRDNKKPTNELQYPYSQKAVEDLIYKSSSKVTPDLSQSSSYSFIWENVATGMIRGELSKFMSERNLAEYLASYGTPEVQKAKDRETAIALEKQRVLPAFETAPSAEPVLDAPPFMSRDKIMDLFNQFSSNFAKTASKRGIEFTWTGLGTWKTPMEIVTEMHIEAWKLSKENILRGDNEYIIRKGLEAGLQTSLAMIQSVPLEIYQDLIQTSPRRDEVASSLLEEYQRQLSDVKDSLERNNRRIPPTLIAAIAYLYQIIRPSHNITRSTPPPETEREEQLNQELQNKIGECNGIPLYNVLMQLIDLERRFYPDATQETILEHINHEWDLDIKGEWKT